VLNDDLTDAFRYAIEHAAAWSADTSSAVIHQILDRLAEAVDDWDASSGEEWVQFIVGSEAVLYLRIDFPLALVLRGYERLLDGIGVVTVAVDDFQGRDYRIDPALLGAIFSHTSPTALDPDAFTIYDLWRAST
jgi:hypothetical protein